ncbi:hypothetical protein WS62_28725 [Burkholderia sp. ABCPW 14]|nr:hypothetical protein WS62_28725 [Burkholderia sp. ABCPW 14]
MSRARTGVGSTSIPTATIVRSKRTPPNSTAMRIVRRRSSARWLADGGSTFDEHADIEPVRAERVPQSRRNG